MSLEDERRRASREMEVFAEARGAALSVDEKIRAWEAWMAWIRELLGIAPGRPCCPPGHVPAGLREPISRPED